MHSSDRCPVSARGPGAYLYAIVPGGEDRELDLVGVADAPVCLIASGNLAAVVSATAMERIRPKRRFVAAHQDVLQRLMADRAVLPVSFGVIADSMDAVRELIQRHRDDLHRQLEQVGNGVEMNLSVAWDVPNVFDYLIHCHAELRRMRDRLWRGGEQPSRDAMLAIGRMFEDLRAEDRRYAVELVTQVLDEHGVRAEARQELGDHDVMRLACLVPRHKVDTFEKIAIEAASLFDEHYAFDYGGPWPPYSFVKLEIQLDASGGAE